MCNGLPYPWTSGTEPQVAFEIFKAIGNITLDLKYNRPIQANFKHFYSFLTLTCVPSVHTVPLIIK